MLLYVMLHVMLAYLMLSSALSNAVCLNNASFFSIDFCKCFLFSALSWFIDTWFVYLKYDFPSCAVLLICWFFLILVHAIFYMKALCALWRNIT